MGRKRLAALAAALLVASSGCVRAGYSIGPTNDRDAAADTALDGPSRLDLTLVCSWSDPTNLAINTPSGDYGPTVTADGLHLFWTSARQGGAGGDDIWTASRAAVDQPFLAARSLANINSGASDSEPSISADGLTLYFNSKRGGSIELWVATRAKISDPFSAPQRLPGSSEWGLVASGPDVAAGGLRLVFWSDPSSPTDADLCETVRSTASEQFATPQKLASINTSDREAFPSLSSDGLASAPVRLSTAPLEATKFGLRTR